MKLIQIGLFLLLSFLVITIHAQKFTTRTGTIIFDGKTPLEDGILGTNNQIYAILDVSNKKILMGGLTQGFNFTKQLMQQHFNENYAETSKYPNTSFKGSFTAPIDVNTKGTYKVDVTGILNFHGVNKTITVPATIIVQSSTPNNSYGSIYSNARRV